MVPESVSKNPDIRPTLCPECRFQACHLLVHRGELSMKTVCPKRAPSKDCLWFGFRVFVLGQFGVDA